MGGVSLLAPASRLGALEIIAGGAVLTRCIVCLAGTACVYMGYRLFMRGVFQGGAQVQIQGGNHALAMDRGGPGLIFALFGMIIIVAGLFTDFGGSITGTSEKSRALDSKPPATETGPARSAGSSVTATIDLGPSTAPLSTASNTKP